MHPGPSGTRRTVTNVSAPLLIGSVARKILIEEIGGDRTAVMAVSRLLVAALLQGSQAIVAHQPSNTMPPDSKPLFGEFGADSDSSRPGIPI
jgi:hypothetical protein